ncbi:unnamed protein product, partial [Porites evermanni]
IRSPSLGHRLLASFNSSSLTMIFTRELFLHTSYFVLNLMMRKKQQMLLARRASYDEKTLTRRVASLASGYLTALLSSPGFLCIQVAILVTFIH